MPSKPVTIRDKIYGEYKISDPVILELLQTRTLIRLKNISQFGPPAKYYHIKPFSRYEHSIGVMLLLRSVGATIEEQVAGLLHDISHTAFSHVVDWVTGSNEKENFQDKLHKKFFKGTEIAKVLKKYGFDSGKISRYENFHLLERTLPELCADRIDYSLREFTLPAAISCFQGLSVHENRFVFRDYKSARLFAENFIDRQKKHWGGFEAGTRYINLARAVKIAIHKRHLVFEDLMKDDKHVVSILEHIDEPEIKKILSFLKKKDLSGLEGETVHFKKKFRYVDPLFSNNGRYIRLSTYDKKFREEIEKAKKENKKGIMLPVIK